MQNSQRQIYQQQIDLLKIQIDEQNKREQKLRQLIDTLTQQMQYQRQVQQQNFRLTQLNEKLLDGIKEAKIRHTEEIKYYDDEIYKLKQEIHQRINQNQRNRVQFQKRQLVFQEKKAMLQSIIEKKCHRVNQLQKKLHEESISKLKEKQKENSSVSQVLSYSRANQQSDKYLSQPQGSNQLGMSTLRISQIQNNFDSQNNMRASNISTISRKSKGGQYLLMNKSEMKVMMGALIKSKREMQKGGIKSSEVGQQRINKTMLN